MGMGEAHRRGNNRIDGDRGNSRLGTDDDLAVRGDANEPA